MKILAFESSCDETSVSVVERCGEHFAVKSNMIASQIETHRLYGGVVPEIASRAHIEAISSLTYEALATAGVTLAEIDAVAVTSNPGLIGALLVGVNFAKALAVSNGKPIIPVEIKIVSIIKKIEKQGIASLEELLDGEPSLPDLIASFLGVLELVKVRKLLIADTVDGEWTRENAVLGADTRFIINENKDDIEESEYLLDTDESTDEQLTIGVDD